MGNCGNAPVPPPQASPPKAATCRGITQLKIENGMHGELEMKLTRMASTSSTSSRGSSLSVSSHSVSASGCGTSSPGSDRVLSGSEPTFTRVSSLSCLKRSSMSRSSILSNSVSAFDSADPASVALYCAPHIPRCPKDPSYLAVVSAWCKVAARAGLSSDLGNTVASFYLTPRIRFSLEDSVVIYRPVEVRRGSGSSKDQAHVPAADKDKDALVVVRQ